MSMILSRAERMLARRYLLPGKGEGFIFVVSSMSLLAVAIGVAALIIVTSVMNGFRAELFDKIIGMNGDAVVQGVNGRLDGWEQIVAAARKSPRVTLALPLIEKRLMASANSRFEGVIIRGMRVQDIRANKTITSNILAGDIRSVKPGCGCVAIGSKLEGMLDVGPGSQITVWNPAPVAVGEAPLEVTYTVAAILETDVDDYDRAFVIMPMQDAQELLLMGDQVGEVEIRTAVPDKVDEIIAPLRKLIHGKGKIIDWRHMNTALYQALVVERVAMFAVLSLIVLVAVFNILCSLIMLVRAKWRDIAILRTMGASRRSMMKVFMSVGMTIGFCGIVLGVIIGAVFLYFRQEVVNAIQVLAGKNLSDPSVRFLTELPSKPAPMEIVAIILTALILSFLSTLYPAFKAASADPVQVLRSD